MNSTATTAGRHAATAIAHPNIALVKYWGKRDEPLNLPAVGSLSITLDGLCTRTRVAFVPGLAADEVRVNGVADPRNAARVTAGLDLLRAEADCDWRAEVWSENNFPTAAGLASSASGFAALMVAGAAALGLEPPRARLSELARRCSGSAARSIFGGFVEWHRGERADGSDSVAEPLHGAGEWPLAVAVAVTSREAKAIGSTEGMRRTAASSPYWDAWVAGQGADLAAARSAVEARDLAALAAVSEQSCLKMHALALAARPGLLYWNAATVACIERVRALQAEGVPVFFTIDAGPQLKAVCLPSALAQVRAALAAVPGVVEVLSCGLGQGACLVAEDAPEPAGG